MAFLYILPSDLYIIKKKKKNKNELWVHGSI